MTHLAVLTGSSQQIAEIVEHPDFSRFATIRTDYVAMLGSRPAAMLLSVVEAWTKWLRARGKSILVSLSGNAISNAVGGLFTRKTFMKAGKLLEEMGLIARVQRQGSNRTYQYLLQKDAVQNRLNLLVWWNTSKTYSLIVEKPLTSNWLKIGIGWLESFLGANVLKGALESPLLSDCIAPCDPTLNDSSKSLQEKTTSTAAAPNLNLEKEVATKPAFQVKNEKKNISEQVPDTLKDRFSEERLGLVKNAGIELNSVLEKTVLDYTLEQVQQAIAHYSHVVAEQGARRKPGGWLTKCLRGQWWLNQNIPVTSAKKQVNPPTSEQTEHLELLKRKGDIVAIMRQDWNDGWALVVDCGNGIVMPWWEVLRL